MRIDRMKDAHTHILDQLNIWLTRHPAPDQPALSVASFGAYSPRELCEAVEQRNEMGQFLESLILFGATSRPGGLNEVLASFVGENEDLSDIDRFSIDTSK